jgi:hypothetical protein
MSVIKNRELSIKLTISGLILFAGFLLLLLGCHKAPIERGPVFSAVENTLAQNGPVKDDLINRSLVELSSNGTIGEIKIGEIEKLVKDEVYTIDEDGYLQFGPDYVPPEPQQEPYFPVQTEKPETYLLALLPGKLVMDKDGYLRIGNALVLWPYGYSFSIEGKDIWILDDKGAKVARVGDEVKIGGGFIPDNVVPMKIGHSLPAGCEGPFWLAAPMSE